MKSRVRLSSSVYSVLVTIDDRGSQPFSLLRLVYGIQRAVLNENALTNFDIVRH